VVGIINDKPFMEVVTVNHRFRLFWSNCNKGMLIVSLLANQWINTYTIVQVY